jgi:hypothetical protein
MVRCVGRSSIRTSRGQSRRRVLGHHTPSDWPCRRVRIDHEGRHSYRTESCHWPEWASVRTKDDVTPEFKRKANEVLQAVAA